MQLFPIALDDALAAHVDTLIAAQGYVNRPEAVRDLVRNRMNHDHRLETVVLRGLIQRVSALAQQLIAVRGLRHGSVHVVPLEAPEGAALHSHGDGPHTHLKPLGWPLS